MSKLLRILSAICFISLWVPFGLAMYSNAGGTILKAIPYSSSVLADDISEAGAWVLLAMTLGIAGAIFTVLSSAARGMAAHKIMSRGVAADAKIISVIETGTRINDDPLVTFILEVRPKHQPAFVGEVDKVVSVLQIPLYQPGNLIRVKHIPGTEQIAVIGPASGAASEPGQDLSINSLY